MRLLLLRSFASLVAGISISAAVLASLVVGARPAQAQSMGVCPCTSNRIGLSCTTPTCHRLCTAPGPKCVLK